MSAKIALVVLVAALSFAGGWIAHSPGPLPLKPIVDASVAVATADADLKRDTILVNKWFPKYDTITLYDTLPIWDTVWVKEYVRVADSTVNSCKRALQSCLAAVRARDTLIVTQYRYIEQTTKPQSKTSQILSLSIGAVGGYLLGASRR